MGFLLPPREEGQGALWEKYARYFLIALSAMGLTAALIYVIVIAVWNMPPPESPDVPRPEGEWQHFAWAGSVALVAGFFLSYLCTITASRRAKELETEQEKALKKVVGDKKADLEKEQADVRRRAAFGKAIHALGFTLFLLALLAVIVFAGFAERGYLGLVLLPAEGTVSEDSITPILPEVIFISMGLSILGAVFFVTNSLRTARESGEEYFPPRLWSGAVFRMGEAMLFTVVFLLVFMRESSVTTARWLPITALFAGMFVMTGERLIFGLGKRGLGAAAALVAFDPGKPKEPEKPKDGDPTPRAGAGGQALGTPTQT